MYDFEWVTRRPLSSSLYQLPSDSYFGNTVPKFKFRGTRQTLGRGWLAIAGGASWSRPRLALAGRILCSFVILCARVLLDRPFPPSPNARSSKQTSSHYFEQLSRKLSSRINSGVEWKAESESSVCGAVGCLPPLGKRYPSFSAPFLFLLILAVYEDVTSVHPVGCLEQ